MKEKGKENDVNEEVKMKKTNLKKRINGMILKGMQK